MKMYAKGDIIRLKTLTQLLNSGWIIHDKYLIPPYWKQDCAISPMSVMLGKKVRIVDVHLEDPAYPYHVKRDETGDMLWIPSSMIEQAD